MFIEAWMLKRMFELHLCFIIKTLCDKGKMFHICFSFFQHRQLRFRSDLLSCLRKEQDPTLKARICDIVGDLSGVVMECNEWPEILTYSQGSIQVRRYV